MKMNDSCGNHMQVLMNHAAVTYENNFFMRKLIIYYFNIYTVYCLYVIYTVYCMETYN